MKLILTTTIALFSFLASAQLTVNTGQTPQQMGNILAGNNINVTNASTTGDNAQFGSFQYVGSDLGLNSGVIISSGDVNDAVGPNSSGGTSTGFGNAGDADLNTLSGTNTNDAAVLEFDFEVQGDEIEFNYVFLSEEYNEYVGAGVNDVFAFFISGPGITGLENLAVVPGTTTPVSVDDINNNSFWQYYNDNENGSVNIEYDGFTTLMTAKKSGLQPCGIYTLSLRIADGGDDILDAAVMLQENSLVQSNISASSNTFSANNTALEGCIDASFTFQLDSAITSDVTISIGLGGSAINGVDYAQIDTLITIPAGQTAATVIIDAIADGITEGQEVIELYYAPSPCAPKDTVLLYIDDYIPLEYNVSPSDVTCNGAANGQVDLSVSGGLAPYTMTLTDSATGAVTTHNSFPVLGLDVGTYYVEVIDGYGCTAEDIVAGNLFDAGQTFIPDGQGGSFQSTITLGGFGGTQTVSSADQIQSVCATMEHSRIGELLVTLTAPDGTQVILKEQPGGAVTNLGEPCALGPTDSGTGNQNTDPGIGYNYCWQNISTFGTMVSEANNYTYTYTNPCDGSQQSDKYLPAGSYQPYEPYDNFIGVPLNGGWTIEVTDQIPNNNGYIFDWSISLQADPPDSIFTITQPPAPIISSSSVDPTCGLSNGSIDLTVTNAVAPVSFSWDNGEITEDISGLAAGTYIVDVTDGNGCVHTHQVDLSSSSGITVSGIVTNETCENAGDGEVDLSVSGGSSPYTFDWSNGEITEDITALAPGTYTVTVEDAINCTSVESFTIVAAAGINTQGAITNENCGDAEGIIDLTVYGGTQPFSFQWSDGSTLEDPDELSQGTYTVELWDANNCYAADTFVVINLVGNCVVACDLAITASNVVDEICGNGAGAIDLSVFTTNGPVQINWDNGAQTEDLNNLSAGSYAVTITDAENCEVNETYTVINDAGNLAISGMNVVNENCGNGQGSIDATVVGGAQPYSYSWSSGEVTEDLSGLNAGTFTLTVTDDNGCSVSDQATVTNQSTGLTQTFGNAVDEVCGNGQGSIDIQISGGQTPYTYSWSHGAISQDLTGLSAGTYTCTITDASGCSITTPTYTVNNDAGTLALSNIDVDNEVCSNGLGEIEFDVTGGSMPYTYNWSNGESTTLIDSLSAGTYSCEVSDANGCSVSTGNLIVINESGSLSLDDVSVFHEACGNGTGSINITVSGGTAPIAYQWNTGSTSEDLTNLSAGNYSCEITDDNGCMVTASGTVQNLSGNLNIDNIIISDESCGQSDGALDLIVSGGTGVLTYNWSNGAMTEDLSTIPAGNYTVTVTDANGCSTSGSATITNLTTGIALDNAQVTNEQCGDGSGAIDLTISGGTTPYTFAWDNAAITEDLIGLSAGTYSCTITDANGCSVTAGPYVVNNGSSGLTIEIDTIIHETCSNAAGEVQVTISGGSAPYTILWSNASNSEDLTGLSAGTYDLTVTDANGCEQSLSAVVDNLPGTLEIANISVTDESCTNGLGAIDITVVGGTMAYSFAWSNAAITEDLTAIAAGTYSVTVSDAGGCSVASGPIEVNNNSGQLAVSGINVGNENCGDGQGYVDLIVTGNQGTLIYNWSNGANTEDLLNVAAGTYTGTATDINGCEISFSAVVGNDAGNLAVSATNTDLTCGAMNGAIDLGVTGGTAPYSFVWSNGAVTEDLTGLNAGSYTCNISDNAGCATNFTTVVNDLGGVEITNVTVNDALCGGNNGSIFVNASGGDAPYTYTWTGQAPIACCDYQLQFFAFGPFGWDGTAIDITIDGVTNAYSAAAGANNETMVLTLCDGQNIDIDWPGSPNGVVLLADPNGNPIFQGDNFPDSDSFVAACSGSGVLDGNNPSNLSPGTYTVLITDANGCQDSATVIIGNQSTVDITSVLITDESCGDANGAIDITATGSGALTFAWDHGPATEDVMDLASGSYSVTITDASGCSSDTTLTLSNIVSNVSVSDTSIVNESCGDTTGMIDITLAGAQGTPTFMWSNGEVTEDLAGLNAGTYTVSITDATGCTVEESYTVQNITNGLTVSAIVTDETCTNMDGAIDVTISGGVAPYTQSWSNGPTSEDLTGLDDGDYTITVTDDSGCMLTETYTVAQPDDLPEITGVTIVDATCATCADGSIDLTTGPVGATITASWDSGQNTEDISSLNPGQYTVTLTTQDGCSMDSTFNVLNTASIDDLGEISVLLLPNPSNGQFSINYENVVGASVGYQVYDATGRTILKGENTISESSGVIPLNIEGAPIGVYYVTMQLGGTNLTKKLVVK